MHTIDTVVIGAGHAGLAVSRLLTEHGREHVVLDRGRVGERWRTERWDSLHLLTPNWMTRLPGWGYDGGDPDGFMSAATFVTHLEGYAASFDAPVVADTTVEDLRAAPAGGYRLTTDRCTWHARHVVIATGPHGTPRTPPGLGATDVLTANAYRNPAQLAPGGVLVVGASASGVQIADELARAGRDVILSVGKHTRMPRRYRGSDIFTWLERTGRLARTIDEVPDPDAARREPSLQLVGGVAADGDPDLDLALDLSTLQEAGVRLTGRFAGLEGQQARFHPDLQDTVDDAEQRLHRFLDNADAHVSKAGHEGSVPPAPRPARPVLRPAPEALDLGHEGITTVLTATGHRPDFPWLRLPILGPDGAIDQYQGVTAAPGVYTVGQRFQHRRDSTLIDGARHGARSVVHHLLNGTLDRPARLPRMEAAA